MSLFANAAFWCSALEVGWLTVLDMYLMGVSGGSVPRPGLLYLRRPWGWPQFLADKLVLKEPQP